MAKRYKIHGRVQGVGFRHSTLRTAVSLGIKGYVRNLYDGTVEVLAEGNENSMNQFVNYLKTGPRMARVERVELIEQNAENKYGDFHIR